MNWWQHILVDVGIIVASIAFCIFCLLRMD